MDFKDFSMDELSDILSNSIYSKVITWYFMDADGYEYIQSSESCDNGFPLFHKDDIYMDDNVASVPKGTFEKLGIAINPMQVLGLVDTTGEYVVSFLSTEKLQGWNI